MTPQTLHRENRIFANTGGVSHNNRAVGFRPAFLDSTTGKVYPSCFADGRPAPIHVLDGLPDDVVRQRTPEQSVIGVKQTIVAGFVRNDRFYTRQQAAQLLSAGS